MLYNSEIRHKNKAVNFDIGRPEKSPDISYAYIYKNSEEIIQCDKEKLFSLLEYDYEDIWLITTPELDGFIIPGENEETYNAVQISKKNKAQNRILWNSIYLGFLSLIVGSFIYLDNSISWGDYIFFFILIASLGLSIVYAAYELRTIKNSTYSNNDINEIQFNHWIESEKPVLLYLFCGLLIFIVFTQYFTNIDSSFENAGLVKIKTAEGEYWRMITAIFLHGSIAHLIFNLGALYYFGNVVLKVAGKHLFFIVYMVAGLLGSFFSLIFLKATSVGASGAILGLIGFLITIGLRNKDLIPVKFIHSLIYTVFAVAVIGLLGISFIDNAAHAGGFLGGVLVGLLISTQEYRLPKKDSNKIKFAGIVSGLILLLGVLFVFYYLTCNICKTVIF